MYFGAVARPEHTEHTGLLTATSQDPVSAAATSMPSSPSSSGRYQGLGHTPTPHSISAPAGFTSSPWEDEGDSSPDMGDRVTGWHQWKSQRQKIKIFFSLCVLLFWCALWLWKKKILKWGKNINLNSHLLFAKTKLIHRWILSRPVRRKQNGDSVMSKPGLLRNIFFNTITQFQSLKSVFLMLNNIVVLSVSVL